MKTTRRLFMQALGAVGLSTSLPALAGETTKWANGLSEQLLGRTQRPTRGMYYLMKLHRETVGRSLFYPAPEQVVKSAIGTYGTVDGDFVWIKVAAVVQPVIFQQVGDATLTKDTYVPVGGMAMRFASYVSMLCKDGEVLFVSKNKCSGDFHNPQYPAVLHTTAVPVLTLVGKFLKEDPVTIEAEYR